MVQLPRHLHHSLFTNATNVCTKCTNMTQTFVQISYIIATSHIPHLASHPCTTSTMDTPLPLEGYNTATQPDCILDCPTALSAVYITLFCCLVGYVYKAGANHWRTFTNAANTAINIVFAACARFLWGRAFVFHWIWWPVLLCKWHFYSILIFTDISDTMSCPYRKTKSFLQSWQPPFPLALYAPNSTQLSIILTSIIWKGN